MQIYFQKNLHCTILGRIWTIPGIEFKLSIKPYNKRKVFLRCKYHRKFCVDYVQCYVANMGIKKGRYYPPF